jgi:hypothetical protein
MKLLIKFPTRSRPEKFFKVLDLYYQNQQDPNNEFIISCDTDDTSMNKESIITKLKTYPNLKYFFENNKSKVEAINNNLTNTDFDILLLASDDMVPVKFGYDTIIKEKMLQNFPDTDGVLWFNDGFQGSNLNTLCIVGKKYFNRFNYIYHPSYNSLYCDTEFTLVSKNLNKAKYFDDIIIQHQQYSIVHEKPDDLYLKNDSLEPRDKAVFNIRLNENFPPLLQNISHAYYIFVHNTELIDFLEKKKKFCHLKNYYYVLLSNNDFETIKYSNVIVAKKQKQNIEKFNNYLQFTGWFCLVANKLLNTDYVTLLEYDVDTDNNIDKIIDSEVLKDQLDCYGYAHLPKTNSFLNNDIFSSSLVEFCRQNNITPEQIIKDSLNPNWIVTSNITIKTKTFINLIKSDFFIAFLNFLKNNGYSGHSLERCLTVMLTLNKIPYRTIEIPGKSVIIHRAFDSHNTQGRHHLFENYQNLL